MMNSHRVLVLLALCVLPNAARAVSSDIHSRKASHDHSRPANSRADRFQRLDTTITVERGTQLDLSAVTAKLIVTSWERSAMELRANSEFGIIQLSTSSRTVRVEAVPGRNNRTGETVMEMRVPKGTRVIVTSRRGDIEITDVGGDVDAHLQTGDIVIRGATGRTSIETLSADVSMSNMQGPVRVSGLSGDISLINSRGDIDVGGATGDVVLRDVQATRVRVELVSGSIVFNGPLAADGRYDFITHAGDVRLYLPEGAKGSLDLQSFNGDLHSSYPLLMLPPSDAPKSLVKSGKTNEHDLRLRHLQRFELNGGGGASLSVSTFTGDVHIDRGSGRPN